MDMLILTRDVERIKQEADKIRASMDSSSGGGGVATIMKQCFCCEEYSIPAGTEYEVCPICGWIDDKYQNRHLDSLDGKNSNSLNEAREKYRSEHDANAFS
jgi:hypothetical protein